MRYRGREKKKEKDNKGEEEEEGGEIKKGTKKKQGERKEEESSVEWSWVGFPMTELPPSHSPYLLKLSPPLSNSSR